MLPYAKHRVVCGLSEVLQLTKSPHAEKRAKGSAGAGKRYEREAQIALRKANPNASVLLNPWYSFSDANLYGACSPDAVVLRKHDVLVLECKLTHWDFCADQLRELYFPVLTHFYAKPVTGVLVCKNLSSETKGHPVCETLAEALLHTGRKLPIVHVLKPKLTPFVLALP